MGNYFEKANEIALKFSNIQNAILKDLNNPSPRNGSESHSRENMLFTRIKDGKRIFKVYIFTTWGIVSVLT